jgi:hypothetical protein
MKAMGRHWKGFAALAVVGGCSVALLLILRRAPLLVGYGVLALGWLVAVALQLWVDRRPGRVSRTGGVGWALRLIIGLGLACLFAQELLRQ